jgi:hypothetical protein
MMHKLHNHADITPDTYIEVRTKLNIVEFKSPQINPRWLCSCTVFRDHPPSCEFKQMCDHQIQSSCTMSYMIITVTIENNSCTLIILSPRAYPAAALVLLLGALIDESS